MPPRATVGTKSPNRSAPRSWRPLASWVNGSGMATDRVVRFTDSFFARLDQLLREERSTDGKPSVTDFLVFDLPRVHDKLSRDVYGQTLQTDEPGVRVYIGLGALVGRFAIFVTVMPDGDVEAFWLAVDDE